jgi:hypothetical protein
MGYSNYKKIKTVVKKFNLSTKWVSLFDTVQTVETVHGLLKHLKWLLIFR